VSTVIAARRTVLDALSLAQYAPSVHNSQPWHWYLGDHSVHLYADLNRWLPATDSQGRDLVVSCGTVLHHARVALASVSLATTVHRQPNPDEPDHLAALELRGTHAGDLDLRLAKAIEHRRTDRRPFTTWPVPAAFLDELVEEASSQGATARVLDPSARADVLRAIREADRVHRELPGYETELAVWSGIHAGDDGVPSANLLGSSVDANQPARRFIEGELPIPGPEVDGSRLLVIGTAGDDAQSQLRAGEALSALLLTATAFGLATCPLSEPLEIPSTHSFVRDQILHGSLVPQILVRVGWAHSGPPLRRTPRRPVADTVSRLES
jgi:nitroreductase